MSERRNQEGSHQRASADIDVGTVVADPKPATKPAPTRGPVDELPPFRVLLHNDDVNSIDHVVDSIMELTPLDHGRAVEVTLEAQQSGAALVLVTHQERAELYRDQFTSKSLTVTIEPVE